MKTKILMACHAAGAYLSGEVLTPIQVGTALAKKPLPGLLHDNEGENISEKNHMYCELTAQYWAWKNLEADYYGLCHYRRFMNLSDQQLPADAWNVAMRQYMSRSALEEIGMLNDAHIEQLVAGYDCISIVPSDLRAVGFSSVRDQYAKAEKLHVEDLDLLLEIIREKQPEYYASAQEYLSGARFFSCNMFIMKKEVFQRYCAWEFSLLAEFERRADLSLYSVEALRTPGHLGERLFGIYYTWLEKQGSYRLGQRQMVMFAYPELQQPPLPAFAERNVPIVLSANDNYAKFAAATIRSILDHADPARNYDIILLQKDMKPLNQRRLQSLVAGVPNMSLRFFNVGAFFEQYHLYESKTISVETYFRLIIPEQFAAYDKVLYLDCDLVAMADVARLFDTDIGDNLLGAVLDVNNAGLINGFDPEATRYNREKLQLKNMYREFNAGVLVMNCKAFRETYSAKYMLDFVQQGSFRFQDQDALNILCEGRVQYLDPAWNFFADPLDGYRGHVTTFAPAESFLAYRAVANCPKIIHYAGNEKPWLYPEYEWAEEFWQAFRRTPFYEAYLYERMRKAKLLSDSELEEKGFLRKLASLVMPKGSRRRETFKKAIFKLIGREYVTPEYMKK